MRLLLKSEAFNKTGCSIIRTKKCSNFLSLIKSKINSFLLSYVLKTSERQLKRKKKIPKCSHYYKL